MSEYIEREAAIRSLGDEPEVWCEHDPVEIQEWNDWNYYKHCIESVPAADVAPVRHGRWIGEPVDIGGSTAMECSECHKVRVVDEYCSACGTLMDGKEDEHGRM